ncbi:MAG: hypothetical protein V3V36_03215 [Candidatus Hydrothermarchaeaceae archaeon]
MKKIIVILCFLISVGIVSAAVPDYIKASASDVSPSGSARIEQPIVATMTLERVSTVPETAKLKISTDLDNPRIEVNIDGDTQDYGLKENDITLPSEGITEIKIRIDGYAPRVEKQIDIEVLNISAHVEYKGEDPADQPIGAITLTVSDKEIRETVITIEDTQDKLAVAEAKIAQLEKSGVNTVELEAKIQNARDLLEEAEEQHEKGNIDSSKLIAESASKILDGVILDAEKMGAGPSPLDIKRYLVIAGAVIAVLILALLIKSKREELG